MAEIVVLRCGQPYAVLVDEGDLPLVQDLTWHLTVNRRGEIGAVNTNIVHPHRRGAGTLLAMHRLIMGAVFGDGVKIDHRDGNPLNNRRDNLRRATPRQNRWNSGGTRAGSSQYKGVHWDGRVSKWRAQICVDGQQRHLGLFEVEADADAAYRAAAAALQGEFARA